MTFCFLGRHYWLYCNLFVLFCAVCFSVTVFVLCCLCQVTNCNNKGLLLRTPFKPVFFRSVVFLLFFHFWLHAVD